MKISITETVEKEVDAHTLRVSLKVSDMFACRLFAKNGTLITEQDSGYVPRLFPGGPGDYVDLDIDIETGQITNWPKPEDIEDELQEWVDKQTL